MNGVAAGLRNQDDKITPMRAVVFESLGPARDVLKLVDIDMPEPGRGEVRVRVHVSAVNPTDWKQRAGSVGGTMPFPRMVPHQDGAESSMRSGLEVDSPAAGRARVAVVRRVAATAGNSRGVRLPAAAAGRPAARSCVVRPRRFLGIPAMTAAIASFGDGRLSGRSVLVAGGAGAVGHFAIQLAKRDGARVVTTVSSAEKAELARAAGADVVVNYREVIPPKRSARRVPTASAASSR